ncbi:MAG: hypothetical protein K2M46_13625 [Lachnospiraceae bacterium]|nr:hypothetical protein [Lachnospiraceae bacterium]
MDNALREWIKKDIKLGKYTLSVLELLFLLGVSFGGFVMRYAMKGYAGADYNIYICPWMEKIHEVGIWKSFGMEVGNYPPLYMYMYALLTVFPCSYLTSVKVMSCLFDYILAATCGFLVYESGRNKKQGMLMYGVILLLPTVAVDSGLWAQADSIYAAFLILSLLFLVKDQPVLSFWFYGISFALKLQSLFLLPLYLVLWTKKKNMKLWHFLLIPLTYVISIIPSWMAGRSLKELLSIYFNHYGEYTDILSMNRPNAYVLTVNDMLQEYIGSAGVWFTLGLLLCVMFYLVGKNTEIGADYMIHAGLLLMMIVTFFLPYMHERYGYVADLLAVAYGILHVKKFYIPIITVACSLGGYVGFVTGTFPIPYVVLALFFLYALYDVAKDLYERCQQEKPKENV